MHLIRKLPRILGLLHSDNSFVKPINLIQCQLKNMPTLSHRNRRHKHLHKTSSNGSITDLFSLTQTNLWPFFPMTVRHHRFSVLFCSLMNHWIILVKFTETERKLQSFNETVSDPLWRGSRPVEVEVPAAPVCLVLSFFWETQSQHQRHSCPVWPALQWIPAASVMHYGPIIWLHFRALQGITPTFQSQHLVLLFPRQFQS